jgi:hypothetical protein
LAHRGNPYHGDWQPVTACLDLKRDWGSLSTPGSSFPSVGRRVERCHRGSVALLIRGGFSTILWFLLTDIEWVNAIPKTPATLDAVVAASVMHWSGVICV